MLPENDAGFEPVAPSTTGPTVTGVGPGEVSVTLRKGILPLASAPEPPHALYGPRATIRADVAAYEAAGCDYLVLNLRRAPSAAALERSLEEVVDILN